MDLPLSFSQVALSILREYFFPVGDIIPQGLYNPPLGLCPTVVSLFNHINSLC
jgi:hypothetical protein